jgi:hypothetical protein
MPNAKLVLLDIEKIKIHKQTRNSSCFDVAQSDNLKNHQTPKQFLYCN